jgi:mRNA interferase RelE/StbE
LSPKEIVFSPNAEDEIKKLPKTDTKVVWGALKKLRDDVGRLDIEKIKSQPNFFRLKVGHMRIIYYPLSNGRVVLLLIRDRKKAYRGLGNLNNQLETALSKLRLARR